MQEILTQSSVLEVKLKLCNTESCSPAKPFVVVYKDDGMLPG